MTLSNVDRVLDRSDLDDLGFCEDLRHVGTPALCERIPGSWTAANGKLYINRGDGAQPTSANTRICRFSSGGWRLGNACNIYIGPLDASSHFETIGGDSLACLRFHAASPAAQPQALVVERGSFRYAGGALSGAQGSSGVSISNLNGLALLVDCDPGACTRDGISASNSSSESTTHLVTVNCTARRTGSQQVQSSNALTLHDNCIGINIAGQYGITGGGAVRIIGASKLLLSGSLIFHDRGDLYAGGNVPPPAVMAGDTSAIWLDGVVLVSAAATCQLHATAEASILRRRMPEPAGRDWGSGFFSRW
ncbi:hypothetical protein KUV75_01025 [Qipengyuania gaetbuli]|uniref:hypothetical protein n=1 Tax=Qipengyuania gaetbuli TaxID=266952 RepID=UPI001C998AD9|nr:hypothetical protein [Qipengyuania gaetbuli]MBY6013489.1 hypothetical protein [Qipengyuania gaetbuli]